MSGLVGSARRAGYRLYALTGVSAFARRRHRQHLLIITYHGLRDGPAPPGTSWSLLPVEALDRQVSYLHAHYRLLTVDDAIAELSQGPLNAPAACITFDDGYVSNYELGRPVLERYQVPATIYLATGLVGTRRILWTIELDLALQQTTASTLDLRQLGLGVVQPGGTRQRARLARKIIAQLKKGTADTRDALLDQLREHLGTTQSDHADAYSFMTWEQVQRFEETGLARFGAHTVNHEIVSRLDDASLEREISQSCADVQRYTRRPSRTFAYPNGTASDFDRRAIATLERNGYAGAVTTIEGLNNPITHRFALRRYNVGADMTFSEFCLLTSGAVKRRARVQI